MGSLEGKEALQRDLDTEELSSHHGMKYYKSKCCILHLGPGNPEISVLLRPLISDRTGVNGMKLH